ncbi:mitochondrial Rho GTPase 2-like [Cicer arietinum]|uniref:Mitochondrial Rho GTPase n=1 Tax=Cicer arietinum TaxID=3827 RepID=A0A1S2XWX3_CICAR|nr:mitochondrial Rho GTPase 2-like [Cicer arietinum]
MASSSSSSISILPSEVRIVVLGDMKTGKSTLIATMASDSYQNNVPSFLSPLRLPNNSFPDSVSLVVIDTPSSERQLDMVTEELSRADAVIVTYDCNKPATFERVSTHWLPKLQRLEVKAPVIVVGCKLDLRDVSKEVNLESLTTNIMQQFREVVTCIECSAATLYQVPEVFYFAQKAALHPVDPLFDYETNALTDRCVRALRRIFKLFDYNMDGTLFDQELNDFQVKCFGASLQRSDVTQIKKMVEQNVPEGVNSAGLTFRGFVEIHNMFLKKGRTETFWEVLRKFGYGNDLKLRDDILKVPSKQASDQSVELTCEAIEFLKGVFRLLDTDKDQLLRPEEVDNLFDSAPESPWNNFPYKDAAEATDMGYLSYNGFLSQWALMTSLDPQYALANLVYIGYRSKPEAVFRVTRKRSEDRKKQKTERNVFQCYVFGSKNAGKSALLYSFLGRPFSDNYTPTTVGQYAANFVELIGGTKKTLVLREIPEDEVSSFLSNRDCLAACDVAVFVHDSSDGYSWKKSIDLLEQVVDHGERTGHKVPCLLIAAKDDLTLFPRTVLDSVKVAQELKIDAPIRLSVKSGDSNALYSRIVNAAEHPHLSLPETEFVKKRKQNQQLMHSIFFAIAGAAMAFAGISVRRARAKRNSS